jgi:hypothetical protein
MTLVPRVVVVHRHTELDGLLARHGTRGQAEFFLRTRGRNLADAQDRHDAQEEALRRVRAAIPVDWRRGDVEREDLYRFGFEADDVCVVVGQDGLVANTAKYLDGQSVIGIDPEPGQNPGVLVTHRAVATGRLLRAVAAGTIAVQQRAMVRATLDDGQSLDALNEVFVGHPSHQSARYRITVPDAREPERQSSSGLIVASGTGSTGWATSIQRERNLPPALPGIRDGFLAWFVREAWPSPTTGTVSTDGLIGAGEALSVLVESDTLVVFGDGLEADRLTATWGQTIAVGVSPRTLRLVG